MTTAHARTLPPLKARNYRFDFSGTPLHWIPDDPFATHVINVLHMIAPVGEKRFAKSIQAALPRLRDEKLRAEVKAFIGQEAAHAHVHEQVLQRLKEQGVDTTDYLNAYGLYYDWLEGKRGPHLPMPEEFWVLWRLALTAAAEQITCVLGDWVLDSWGLEDPAIDPAMLQFLRWHGAEEVEHRSVAFNVLTDLAGPAAYPMRVAGMMAIFPSMSVLWHLGTTYMLQRDASLKGRWFGLLDVVKAVQRDHLPGWEIYEAVGRYVLPGFHPDQESADEKALAFFAQWAGPPRAA